jgi:hypothetical protein
VLGEFQVFLLLVLILCRKLSTQKISKTVIINFQSPLINASANSSAYQLLKFWPTNLVSGRIHLGHSTNFSIKPSSKSCNFAWLCAPFIAYWPKLVLMSTGVLNSRPKYFVISRNTDVNIEKYNRCLHSGKRPRVRATADTLTKIVLEESPVLVTYDIRRWIFVSKNSCCLKNWWLTFLIE